MRENRRHILMAEDDPDITAMLGEARQDPAACRVTLAADSDAVLAAPARPRNFDLLLLELLLPKVAGAIVVAGGAVTGIAALLVMDLILHLLGIKAGDGLTQVGEQVEHDARLFERPWVGMRRWVAQGGLGAGGALLTGATGALTFLAGLVVGLVMPRR